jgi:short chain dehydrogenase
VKGCFGRSRDLASRGGGKFVITIVDSRSSIRHAASAGGKSRTAENSLDESKDPGAPASPDARTLPVVPYSPVLAGQPALVTGANSGIGKAVALGLARAGADVVINYVTNPADASRSRMRSRRGRRAIAIQADVSNEDQVEAMFAKAIDHFGTLHVLVSNAGLQRDAPYEQMTLDQLSTVICTRAAAREFKRRPVDQAVSIAAGKILWHEFGASGDYLGRACKLCGIEGRRRHADAQHCPGARAPSNPRQQHR